MGGALAAAVAGGVVASTPASAATHTTHPAHTARAAFTAPAAPAAPAVHPAPAARAAHPAEAARPAAAPASRRVRTLPVSHGVVDGTAWSVSLEYYAYVPAGYDADPDRTITGVVCQRMYIGGVRVDHQGGPWSDCWGVTGPGDTYGNGSTGLWGFQDKGLSGSRLFVGIPNPGAARVEVTLDDGTVLRDRVTTLAHTVFGGWAVAIPDGRVIESLDTYDAAGVLISHDTDWR
jgi:hypothetical protein